MTRNLTAGEFARLFTTRGPRIAWFLGAGASAAAGIATGYDMIGDFKARLFAEATNLPRRQVDPGDPLWAERITAFFDGQHGFPAAADPAEYSVAFERVYPEPEDRRAYIEEQVRRGTASYGHRVLAALISARQIPCVATTNFDPLVERATVVTDDLLPAEGRAHLVTASIDSAERAERVLAEETWPLLIKLHGDYQEVALKNTEDELRSQDERLRAALTGVCKRFGLLVVGYSGRDDSVMSALHGAVAAGAFPSGLFWVRRPSETLLPAVVRLLEAAAAAGVETSVVEVATFDELSAELARQTKLPRLLAEHVEAARVAPVVVPVKLPTVEAAPFPVLRCSALPILKVPDRARQLTVDTPVTTRELRDRLVQRNVRHAAAAALGRQVAAFGRDAELLEALSDVGARVDGTVALDPLQDSWAAGLLVDALAGALARGRPVRRRMHRRLHTLLVRPPDADRTDEDAERLREQVLALQTAYGSDLTGTIPVLELPYAEGVYLRLERRVDRWWCVYEPFTWVQLPRHPEHTTSERREDPSADWRRERWAKRYNQTWSQIIDAWANLLAGAPVSTVRTSHVLGDAGVPGAFTLSCLTGWARSAGEVAGDLR